MDEVLDRDAAWRDKNGDGVLDLGDGGVAGSPSNFWTATECPQHRRHLTDWELWLRPVAGRQLPDPVQQSAAWAVSRAQDPGDSPAIDSDVDQTE